MWHIVWIFICSKENDLFVEQIQKANQILLV